MCGLFGAVWTRPDHPGLPDDTLDRVAQSLRHRGPDGTGIERLDRAAFVHTRLAILDPSDAGRQPMSDPSGRFRLLYNGELYNDAELRAELGAEGVRFRGTCDTETVLHALTRWGAGGVDRLRGMLALAFYDAHERTLLLARDPLGVKPLVWCEVRPRHGGGVAFASEPAALFESGLIAPEPDPVTISGYLTNLRITLGERTMFAGVRTLEPGDRVEFDLSGDAATSRRWNWWDTEHAGAVTAELGPVIADSVRRHLRSDVPTCALLSGGLDSTIIAACAREETDELHTYCAGAHDAGDDSDDFAFARRAAETLGTMHHEAPVDRDLFITRWIDMVGRAGVPLGTPNEVAINEVARSLRARGHVVALSGEGADELFAGYERPIDQIAAFLDEHAGSASPSQFVDFEHATNGWVQRSLRPRILTDDAWSGGRHDDDARAIQIGRYERNAARGADGMRLWLDVQREVNLEGLLRRLDSATMLESVEGRTPFADAVVATVARGHAIDDLYRRGGDAVRTKLELRTAFA
ncbi:MAG: asparagine synthase (glutamine-hydrolyzing), partial [Planctomycetota bacterium]